MMSIDSLISSAKSYNWFRDDSITNSASVVQKDGVIVIKEHIKRSQWQEFESALEGISNSLVVITDGLPQEWINNKKLNVLRTQSVLRLGLKKIDHHIKNYKFNYFNRKFVEIEYDYFLMYGRWEYHRETVVKELESRAVLANSLYSRPSVEDQPGRSIEDNRIDAPLEFRFNHGDNFNMVIKNSQRCHCSVVLENNGLLTESDGTITEKSMWPVLAQVPFVWAVAPNRIQQLTEWGFRPNDPPRNNLRSFTEQLMWLRSEFTDPIKAQRWQDDQGETINHNLTILKGLADRIDEDTQQQLAQLG
jgi:hypothetical protein